MGINSKYDEFGATLKGVCYINREGNSYNLLSLPNYCEKYLNEGYEGINLKRLEEILLNNKEFRKITY